MQQRIIKRAQAFAAVANPVNNASPTEQATAFAKLQALCEKHGLNIADFIPPVIEAQPEPVEAAEQPAPDAADSKRAKRRAVVRSILDQIRVVYAGASPSFRRSARALSIDTYAARVLDPSHRIGPNGPSERDDSGLLGLIAHASETGVFDPVALCVDLGVISRLASVGFVTTTDDLTALQFTDAGLSRARGVVSRAAKQ